MPDSTAMKAERRGNKKVVYTKNLKTGRCSNADVLKPEKTGVETDRRGWIKVNKYMETGKPGIYALGDATDRYMFKHTANYEADIVSDNLLRGKRAGRTTRMQYLTPYTHIRRSAASG